MRSKSSNSTTVKIRLQRNLIKAPGFLSGSFFYESESSSKLKSPLGGVILKILCGRSAFKIAKLCYNSSVKRRIIVDG